MKHFLNISLRFQIFLKVFYILAERLSLHIAYLFRLIINIEDHFLNDFLLVKDMTAGITICSSLLMSYWQKFLPILISISILYQGGTQFYGCSLLIFVNNIAKFLDKSSASLQVFIRSFFYFTTFNINYANFLSLLFKMFNCFKHSLQEVFIFEIIIIFNYLLIQKSMSKEDHFESGKYQRSAKLFITNLPPSIPEDQLRNEIEPLFQAYGKIRSINVKKHKSGQYSYAFLQFERIEDAIRSIEEMDQKPVHQRPMKVRQDRQSEGCFNCKKTGHFAKQCPLNGKQQRQGRDKSRSGERYNRDPDYGSQRRNRREKQRSRQRDRSRSYSYDRRERRYRRQRSRSKDYSPDHYRRRQYRRERHGRQGSPRSRSRSDSYQQRDRYSSRRGEYNFNRQRESRREGNRKYRRQSRSPSYERGERGGR